MQEIICLPFLPKYIFWQGYCQMFIYFLKTALSGRQSKNVLLLRQMLLENMTWNRTVSNKLWLIYLLLDSPLYCISMFVLIPLFLQNLHIRITASLFSISFFRFPFFLAFPPFFYCCVLLLSYIMCTFSVLIIIKNIFIHIHL